MDLTYDYEYLGADSSALNALLKGESAFSKVFLNIFIANLLFKKKKLLSAKCPLIIVGIQAFQGEGSEFVQFKLQQLADKIRSNGTNFGKLHRKNIN